MRPISLQFVFVSMAIFCQTQAGFGANISYTAGGSAMSDEYCPKQPSIEKEITRLLTAKFASLKLEALLEAKNLGTEKNHDPSKTLCLDGTPEVSLTSALSALAQTPCKIQRRPETGCLQASCHLELSIECLKYGSGIRESVFDISAERSTLQAKDIQFQRAKKIEDSIKDQDFERKSQ